MTEPLDPPVEIDDSPRDEEIAALKEDVKALRGMLRRALVPIGHYYGISVEEGRENDALIAEIEKELEN